jgi:hypothetical protein
VNDFLGKPDILLLVYIFGDFRSDLHGVLHMYLYLYSLPVEIPDGLIEFDGPGSGGMMPFFPQERVLPRLHKALRARVIIEAFDITQKLVGKKVILRQELRIRRRQWRWGRIFLGDKRACCGFSGSSNLSLPPTFSSLLSYISC